MISSEIEELLRTCARVIVLRDRRRVAEVSAGPELTAEMLMRRMAEAHE